MDTDQTIKETTLRELAEADSITSTCVVGKRRGFAITVCYGKTERTLASTRGDVRLFTLDNAAKFLRDMGIAKFEVDATAYEPGRIRKPRPDRSEAMRRTRTRMKQTSLLPS